MNKSALSLAVAISALFLAVTPSAYAINGTNPRPQVASSDINGTNPRPQAATPINGTNPRPQAEATTVPDWAQAVLVFLNLD